MTPGGTGWRSGLARLAERVARTPEALRAAAALADPAFTLELSRIRRFLVTGLGSSAAHARFLAFLLSEHAGARARFAPLGELLGGPPEGAEHDALVVFSQGLSPSIGFALARPDAWRSSVLMTAVEASSSTPRGRQVAALADQGVTVLRYPEENEFDSLVRVIGPLTGYVRALRFARSVAELAGRGDAVRGPLQLDVEPACRRIEGARAQVDSLLAGAGPPGPGESVVFLASGAYGALVDNLRLKLLEGWLAPLPPVWDPIELSHGPLQALTPDRATLLALVRPGDPSAPREREVLGRLEATLDPQRHRLLRLEASLPAPLAILEHEALLNDLLLRGIAAREIDVAAWPGRGREAPLYDFAPGDQHAEVSAPARRPPTPRRDRPFDEWTWPEVEAELARGGRTAVVPLGATEQHGPHLPLATDAWIATELARRFCARVPEAVQAPTLSLGCSPEHLAFPGTLSLSAATLQALLADVVASLEAHGFERIVLFSAHGGNVGVLEDAARELRARPGGAQLLAYTDLGRLTRLFQDAGAARGIAPEAIGHHAGELETSIVLALRPDAVRRDALTAGTLEPSPDAQHLFHPSLRAHAPHGTVGDPRAADPRRAEPYLATWTDELVGWYGREKNRHHTKGTVKP